MNVLVLGSGGREHALCWKIATSTLVERVFAVPGNPGIAVEAKCTLVPLSPTDGPGLVDLCRREEISLVVIGPEQPLVEGVADVLRSAGIAVVGPGADGAQLEGSKSFCKQVFVDAGIPTAQYARVTTAEEVNRFVDAFTGRALVVKADGLAAGKGVIVCDSAEEARVAAIHMLETRPFGDASSCIVLEERLEGIEVSYMVLTDGWRFAAFPTSQDHKRLFTGDLGPNTGGMGAFSPATFLSEDDVALMESMVIEPTLVELRRRGIDYRGFLYAGVMLTERGPMVLEYNCRLGDPETQVLMMAVEGDIVPALVAAAQGELESGRFPFRGGAAVVVMAAEGYPESPVKGAVIDGLDHAARKEGVKVFHAGTREDHGSMVVNGGRVLGVAASATTPNEAVALAYEGMSPIRWNGMQFRTDIGKSIV
jgi:phosphoribosylamine---glycine ligase